MKRITHFFLITLLGAYSHVASAGNLLVAVASDLQFAMAEMAATFEKANPGIHIETVSGSSGKFYQQIANGAPFDLYFSADIEYPRKLRENGLAASEVKPYAFGRLVLWSAALPVSAGLAALTDDKFIKVAIANPEHAPYGKAAKASLTYYGLLDKVAPKLVFGENVSQAAQFAQTGAAEGAIIALSLVTAPTMKGKGQYFLIDERSHPPLEQGYVVLKQAQANPDAAKFSVYIASAEARVIFKKFGFRLPGEQ
ncbi:MAG: molybdate ABC transporter substrate-binding protein [Methylotenera sp.]|nr:molybdate ABC transporter substrate-binding protein [Methylotenera sp.]